VNLLGYGTMITMQQKYEKLGSGNVKKRSHTHTYRLKARYIHTIMQTYSRKYMYTNIQTPVDFVFDPNMCVYTYVTAYRVHLSDELGGVVVEELQLDRREAQHGEQHLEYQVV
jgi:hypothetical protein